MSTLYGMLAVESVTSAANPLLKKIRRALAKGGLTPDGLCIAEGSRLVDEALRSRCTLDSVLVSHSSRASLRWPASRVIELPDKLFENMASTETTQGVLALVRPPIFAPSDLFQGNPLVIVLDGVQDPGNAGTIVRASEAFGATGVLFIKGTVHPWQPKTLRASAGSLFRMPIATATDASQARDLLLEHSLQIYAAMPYSGAERLAGDVDFTQGCAIVIGNEGQGVSDELRSAAQEIAIPTTNVESLNAAIAASVLLYEIRRQRVRTAPPA